MRPHVPSVCLGLSLFALLTACTPSYVLHTAQVRTLAEAGQYTEALKELDAEASRASLDALLVSADQGGLLHRAGAWEASSRALNEAAALADARETVRLSEELFGSAPWRMGTLERQALHTLNALNYLQLGRPEQATVEARLTNALHLRQHLEKVHRARFEQHLRLVPFDEDFRAYLERSAIGLYVSGLAHELAGNEESAFLDYLEAWRVTRSAPPGAPSHLKHLEPKLLAESRRLERVERSELERLLPGVEARETGPEDSHGELVVIVEAGRIPQRCVLPNNMESVWSVCARDWSHARAAVEVGGHTWPFETVTSLENLLLRRGGLGVLSDTERAPSIAVNTGLVASYLLLPPVAGVLLSRRVIEVGTRMEQGWLSLPAEFQVARVSLPKGRHAVRIQLGSSEQVREVDVVPRRPQVLVVPMN